MASCTASTSRHPFGSNPILKDIARISRRDDEVNPAGVIVPSNTPLEPIHIVTTFPIAKITACVTSDDPAT
jgi:hypothetical protein